MKHLAIKRQILAGLIFAGVLSSCGENEYGRFYKFPDFFPFVSYLKIEDISNVEINSSASYGEIRYRYKANKDNYQVYYSKLCEYLANAKLKRQDILYGSVNEYVFTLSVGDDTYDFEVGLDGAIINSKYYVIDKKVPLDGDISYLLACDDNKSMTFSSFGANVSQMKQGDVLKGLEFVEDTSKYTFDYTSRYILSLSGASTNHDWSIRLVDATHFFYNLHQGGSILYTCVNGFNFSSFLASHPVEENYYLIKIKQSSQEVANIKCDKNVALSSIPTNEIISRSGYPSIDYTFYSDEEKTMPVSSSLVISSDLTLYI